MRELESQPRSAQDASSDFASGDSKRAVVSPPSSPPDIANRLSKAERLKLREAKLRKRLALEVRKGRDVATPLSTPVPANDQSGTVLLLTSLPQSRRKTSWGAFLAFFLAVLLPTLIAGTYYFYYASRQYVAEFHFAVRNSSTATQQSSATSMLSSLLGVSSPGDMTENYVVADYLTSRQAAEQADKEIGVKKMYGRKDIDWWARFDASQPMEKFAAYWRHMVTAHYDQITGIATAEVRAFSPEDALSISNTLVRLAENLVNDISERPRREAIAFAEGEVKRAEERLKTVRADLSKYRSAEGVIEPTAGVVTSTNTVATGLRQALTQMQADAASLAKQNISESAPQMMALQSRIKATREQLAAVEGQVGKTPNGTTPLSQVVGNYEQLDLERQFAQNVLVGAMQALEQARGTAMTQRIYITPYVRPALPESSTYPNAPVATLTVFGMAFLVWVLGFLIVRSMREHIV